MLVLLRHGMKGGDEPLHDVTRVALKLSRSSLGKNVLCVQGHRELQMRTEGWLIFR